MSKDNWPILYTLADSLQNAELGNGDVNLLASELDHALCSNKRSDLETLAPALAHLYSAMYQRAPLEARTAADPEASPALRAAWNLARVDFACHIAAQGLAARADQSFLDALQAPHNQVYLQAMASGGKSNAELKDCSGHEPETVSRKLRDLREAGVCSFQRIGKEVINSMTPLALELWQEANPGPQAAHEALRAQYSQATLAQFQRMPNFIEKTPA
ncbi:hypothetical protein V8J88_02500 [Massilia sp. W12]|uniref:hypothetical protein n=1 Tax=Massilia sp. W12 TaxID=3126507 RepID=UPI0030CFE79B